MKIKLTLGLLVLIVLSFLVRFYAISKSPPSVNFDEAALGYNAYSLLKTGKDEYGRSWPLSLRSFNDFKPALYSYFSIPFVSWFGLNETSTRMVSVISGSLRVIVYFFLLRLFLKGDSKKIWLYTLILSLQPWELHFSRTAFESNLSCLFFTIGAVLLLYYKEKKSGGIYLFFSILAFLLSIYSYHSARLGVPIFVFLVFFDPFTLSLKSIKKGVWVLFWLLLGVAPLLYSTRTDTILERFNQENIFKHYYPFASKESDIGINRYYYLAGMMVGHVASYFSPINIGYEVYHWVRLSPQYIPSFSMLGWEETIFVIIGFFMVLRKFRDDYKIRILVYWIIAGSAPSAVTWNWFHPLRALNLMPVLGVFAIMGLDYIIETRYKKIYLFLVLVWLIPTGSFRVTNELSYSVWKNHGEYQPGGFKQGAALLGSLANEAKTVYLDSSQAQSYIFFLFYQSYPPVLIQKYASVRPAVGVEGDLSFNFGNYVYRKFDWPAQHNEENVVYWTSREVKDDEIKKSGGMIFSVANAVSKRAAVIIKK